MKKFALLLSLVFAAGVAAADQAQKADAAKPAAKVAASEKAEKAAPAKTHDVTAEVVSVDAEKKTITIKGEKENLTAPVEGKAIAALKTVKSGTKYVLTCRDDEKGEHKAVTAIHVAAEAKAPAKAEKKN
jgi:Zn/Cd-binding protein ZinT